MPLATLLGTTMGVAVGAAATYGVLQYKSERKPPVATEAVRTPLDHPATKHGMPIKERVRLFSGYVAGYDPATRNPTWVLERIQRPEKVGPGDRQNSTFREDSAIPPRFRSRLVDYKGSGYDRGHMAPASNHKASQQHMDDTFFLTNISPQVGEGFNRDYWARFEKFVQDITRRADDVFVVSGPVFAPALAQDGRLQARHTFIGAPPQAVAVPTHYYKVVLAESKRDGAPRYALGAFVMPNAPIEPNTPLTSFVVPVDFLEAVTGVEFFPQLMSDRRRAAVDEAALGWRRLGAAHHRALAIEGVTKQKHQGADGLAGVSTALVPAGQGVPPSRDLAATGVASGPLQFRPSRTVGGDGLVHLCENVACRLPAERFWEAKKGPGSGSSGRGVR